MARSILTSTSIFRRRDYSRNGIREIIEILFLLEATAFIRHAYIVCFCSLYVKDLYVKTIFDI